MSTLFRAFVLFAAIGAVMAAGNLASTAPAQVKEKKDTKKADAIDEETVGTVEVYKAKDGWRYRVKNSAGKSIAIPVVGYETPEDAQKILDLVKNTLSKAKVKVLKDK